MTQPYLITHSLMHKHMGRLRAERSAAPLRPSGSLRPSRAFGQNAALRASARYARSLTSLRPGSLRHRFARLRSFRLRRLGASAFEDRAASIAVHGWGQAPAVCPRARSPPIGLRHGSVSLPQCMTSTRTRGKVRGCQCDMWSHINVQQHVALTEQVLSPVERQGICRTVTGRQCNKVSHLDICAVVITPSKMSR